MMKFLIRKAQIGVGFIEIPCFISLFFRISPRISVVAAEGEESRVDPRKI